MNLNKEYRRCRRAWKKLARDNLVIRNEQGLIVYERLVKGKGLAKGEIVQTWREYVELDHVYLCHYCDSYGRDDWTLFEHALPLPIVAGARNVDAVAVLLSKRIEQLLSYLSELRQD